MSSAQVAANAVRGLEPEDLAVLSAIEKSIPSFESVPVSRVQKAAKLHLDQVKFRLGKLNKLGFVMSTQHGYVLLTAGLDVLALKGLVNSGKISGMGKAVGMGKESDVFEVVSDSGERAVIKFYRIGRTSFRSTRRGREYTDPRYQHQWLTVNVNAAAKEAEGLVRASKAMVRTPAFIARNRNAVVMQEIFGTMLHYCSRKDVRNPKSLLRNILSNVRLSFVEAQMINGDLSEYNIIYDGDNPWIIDWPQFVGVDHENAADILRRDIINVVSFFEKKFDSRIDIEKSIDYVKGKVGQI